MKSNGGAIIAKADAIYGRRITQGEYNSLIHKSSVSQVVGALKETARYKNELASVNEQQIHRGQIEMLLNKSVFDIYMRLCRFVPGGMNGFNGFHIRKTEIDIILNAVMFINAGQHNAMIAYLPAYMERYTSFELMALAHAKNFDDVLKILADTHYYDILKNVLPNSSYRSGDTLNLEELSLALYADYYKHLFKTIDNEFGGLLRNNLRETVFRHVTLDNLLIAYRMKTFFNRSADDIRRLTLPFSKGLTREAAIEMFSSKNAGELILKYMDSRFFKGRVSIDTEFPETAVTHSDKSFFLKNLRIPGGGAMALYSLLRLLEIEKQNVFTVIEGVRYSLPASEIEKMLVI